MMITLRKRRFMAVAGLLAFAVPTLAFAGSATVNWDKFAPLIFGDGSDEVVVFTAPSCPYCRQLIDHLPALAKRYRVIVLPISFTSYDAQRVRALACAADQDAAARALLLHQDVILPQQEPCDLPSRSPAILMQSEPATPKPIAGALPPCPSSFDRMAKSAKASARISMPGSPEEPNHDR